MKLYVVSDAAWFPPGCHGNDDGCGGWHRNGEDRWYRHLARSFDVKYTIVRSAAVEPPTGEVWILDENGLVDLWDAGRPNDNVTVVVGASGQDLRLTVPHSRSIRIPVCGQEGLLFGYAAAAIALAWWRAVA